MNRDLVVGAGHSAITASQFSNAVTHAIAACDVQGTDVVADGVIDDPRQCTYSAAADGAKWNRAELECPMGIPGRPRST